MLRRSSTIIINVFNLVHLHLELAILDGVVVKETFEAASLALVLRYCWG